MHPGALVATLVLLVTCPSVSAETPVRPSVETSRILKTPYPLDATVSFPAALLHWLDSLAELHGPGMTSGKTATAHRLDYRERLGEPTSTDLRMLQRFAEIRVRFAERRGRDAVHDLTLAFFEASSLEDALKRSARLLGRAPLKELRRVTEHFSPSYSRIWRDGELARSFVRRARNERRRAELSRFLARVAAFYGVSAQLQPTPRLILVPVRDGHGTHAQAIGHTLLIEIREWEGLLDEVSPIVHENAHFLFASIAKPRLARLARAAHAMGDDGVRAWSLLLEALPTAIGQGVAGERFLGKRWARYPRWYHRDDVDRYAKRIFPLVASSLAGDGVFDTKFLEAAADALNDSSSETLTPRSP